MTRLRRFPALVGLAARQLTANRARTLFAIGGVAFAVLSVTLLFGVGIGVVETGETLLDESDRDLWVSGGPIEFQPGTVGGFQSPIVDAHNLSGVIQSHEDVKLVTPLSFQTVYASTDGEEFDTVIGTGVINGRGFLNFEAGSGFTGGGRGDTHYAGGDYDGPMTHEAIIDSGIAAQYDLEVGDTLYVGGTITNAQRNEFEVVGISSTLQKFLGTQTVAIRLSELQTLTGTAYDDRVTVMTIELEDGADLEAVKADLEEAYPEYTIRTNQEQFRAVLERQALVIAGGVTLVGLAILAGMLLSLNLFLSLIYQQREELAIYRAIGGSRSSTVVIAVVQASAIAIAGCLLGLGLSPPLAMALDYVALTVTGFEGLVQIPREGYLIGIGVAAVFGLIGTLGGVLRISREKPVARLTR